jgi:hypothetical protein
LTAHDLAADIDHKGDLYNKVLGSLNGQVIQAFLLSVGFIA